MATIWRKNYRNVKSEHFFPATSPPAKKREIERGGSQRGSHPTPTTLKLRLFGSLSTGIDKSDNSILDHIGTTELTGKKGSERLEPNKKPLLLSEKRFLPSKVFFLKPFGVEKHLNLIPFSEHSLSWI